MPLKWKYAVRGATAGLIVAVCLLVLYRRLIAVTPSPHEGAYDVVFLASYALGFPVSGAINLVWERLVQGGVATPSSPIYALLPSIPILWGMIGALFGTIRQRKLNVSN